MDKKTLELVFKDMGDKNVSMSFDNPRDDISMQELRALESTIVDGKIFDGPTGDLKGFGRAFVREVKEKDLLEG